MATYSKETALYDTGAIADDIAGAGNTANYYLTTISGTSGISVHNKNDTSNYVNINSTDGMNVVKGGTNVAQFGTTARVGSASSSHFNMNASSLQAYDSNNNKYFEVSSSGITYGSNTVANTSDVSNAVNAVEVYSLDSSYPSVTVDTNGSHPTSLTLSSTYTKGSAAPASYAGRIKVETSTDNTNWTALYTSSSNESSKTITTPTNVEDSEPYVFRQTPSGAGNAVDDSAIVGGTIAWNQLVRLASAGTQTYANMTIKTNSDGSIELNGTASESFWLSSYVGLKVPTATAHRGHTVLMCFNGNATIPDTRQIGTAGAGYTSHNNCAITNSFWSSDGNPIQLRIFAGDSYTNAKFYPQFFDLTQMFGSTIADYIYSLEQSTAGAGVAYFKKLGFTKPYYAYNAGELMSVNAVGQKTVGFNVWDEEWELGGINYQTGATYQDNNNIRSKNFIPVVPLTQYYYKAPNTSAVIIVGYDADYNYVKHLRYNNPNAIFTTSDSSIRYIKFCTLANPNNYGNTYNHDICINISDPSRNGAYEPYNEHTYDLANLTLRGVPKFVNNKVTYDGDTYESDGTVTRKYGIVTLDGSGDSYTTWATPTDPWIGFAYYGLRSKIKLGRVYGMAVDQGFISNDGGLNYRNIYSVAEVLYITIERSALSGTSVSDFKTWLSTHPITVVYPLATPTTETAQSFTSLKSIDAYGTERYIDGLYEAGTRDVAVPVGHISKYASGVKSIRASLYKAGGTTTLLAQKIIPFTANLGGAALNDSSQLESYSIDSYPSVALSIDGATPSALTLSAKRTKGSALEDYSGRIKVETSLNNSTWTTEYTSSTDESSVTYNSPSNITDNEPYNFRAVPSGVGNVMRDDSIVGGTVAWNQLTEHGNFDSASGWNKQGTFTVANNIGTWVNDSSGGNLYRVASGRKNHVYFLTTSIKTPTETTGIYIRYSATSIKACSATTAWQTISTIYKRTADDVDNTSFGLISGLMGESVQVKNFMQIDLTQMFGSTIADYIYSLETATAGAGVAWFKKLFPKPYYAYNAGELKSVSGLISHDMTGFNQFDGESSAGYWDAETGAFVAGGYTWRGCTNYIPCLPNTTYYYKVDAALSSSVGYFLFYDADKNYLGYNNATTKNQTFVTFADAHYMTFYANKAYFESSVPICINLAWDGSRNGEYEPYEKHSYPLDSDLTLRGMPKLDANNNLYYDGDIYESDGTVTRKYGIVDLGTLAWSASTNFFYASLPNTTPLVGGSTLSNCICPKYVGGTGSDMVNGVSDKCICISTTAISNTSNRVYVRDTSYSTSGDFKTAMSGVYLVYELATPTTETADPFQSPQVVNDFGTEEYVTTGIPVGHNSTYISGVKAIRASLYKAGGTTSLLAQKIIPCGTDLGSQAIDAAQTATTYITAIDDSGIKVHASNNPNSNYSKIDAEGLEVYKGGSSVAAFGVETRIGQQDASRVELTSNTIALIAENGADALRAVTSGKEISQISTINSFYTDLPSNTNNNVFTIDLSGVANGKPFYVDIESIYGYRFTVSTATSVGYSDHQKRCDSVRLGFTKGTTENPKQATVKMVDSVTPQPQGFFTTRVNKTVTVAYNVSNSTITITTPTYPTIADSQLVEQYQTRYVTNGRSYLVLSVVSAYFSEYIPQTEIYGRTYLDMNTDGDIGDDIDESILTSLTALGWTTYCTQ